MQSQDWPHAYLVVEGNIGAGKTTLCHRLAELSGARLVLEQFADNPFLPYFYEDPARHALSVELFFMAERHKQMQALASGTDLFQQKVVADFFFNKTLLFARQNLLGEEYRLFRRLFDILYAAVPKPDLLVYVHRQVPTLQRHIQRRGRSYEQQIGADYLLKIQEAYFDFFRQETGFPILVVDADGADFIGQPAHMAELLRLIGSPYEKGLHLRSIAEQSSDGRDERL